MAVIIAAGAQGICSYIRRDPLTRLRMADSVALFNAEFEKNWRRIFEIGGKWICGFYSRFCPQCLRR